MRLSEFLYMSLHESMYTFLSNTHLGIEWLAHRMYLGSVLINRYYGIVFQNDQTRLQPDPQCADVAVASQPCQHRVLPVFHFSHSDGGVAIHWHHIVVLNYFPND